MRYDAHSGIAVLHGVGILEKGNQMAEPISYIVEIDEQGNTSIKYEDGTPYAVNIAEYSAEVLKQLAPCKMKMWLYPKPTREIQYSKPYCVDFKPFLRESETVDSKDEYETVRDMNYGSVEASVKETVYDSGCGECLVLVERCSPYIPAPVIYRCTRSKGVVNCEVVAS